MTNPRHRQIIRPVGVAVISLFLIVGGAFAADGLAGSVAPRGDVTNAAAPADDSPDGETEDATDDANDDSPDGATDDATDDANDDSPDDSPDDATDDANDDSGHDSSDDADGDD